MKPTWQIWYDDGTTSPPLFFAMIGNSSPYSYVGKMAIVFSPDAHFDRTITVTSTASTASLTRGTMNFFNEGIPAVPCRETSFRDG